MNWLNNYNLLIFDEIDSTNEEAKRLARAGVNGDFLIWAKSQTSGKGRYGRNWVSSPGNMYLTLLLQSHQDLIKSSELSFVTAVAVGEILATKFNHSNKQIHYKWPNDILLDGKKLAGILLESLVKPGTTNLDCLIIGVGINIDSSPTLESYKTTNLLNEEATDPDLNKLIDHFMQSFCHWLKVWTETGFSAIRTEWLKRGLGIGQVITVSVGKDRISGVFEDITNDGCIKLALPGGQICFVSSGEVFYDATEYNSCKIVNN